MDSGRRGRKSQRVPRLAQCACNGLPRRPQTHREDAWVQQERLTLVRELVDGAARSSPEHVQPPVCVQQDIRQQSALGRGFLIWARVEIQAGVGVAALVTIAPTLGGPTGVEEPVHVGQMKSWCTATCDLGARDRYYSSLTSSRQSARDRYYSRVG